MAALRRYAPMKASAGTVWPAEVREHVAEHQSGCMGLEVEMPGRCMGTAELDHVRAGGTSIKSKSIATNGARFCSWHHSIKTREGRKYRPLILDAIARLHGECARCQREAIETWGAPLTEGVA